MPAIFRRAGSFLRCDSGAPALTELLPGQPVTVWTEPAAVTPQAQLGAPGALTAARVVLQSYS